MRKVIRNQDIFGHPVNLNFNNNGSVHKTLCGGVASLLIKVIVLLYMVILLRKLVLQLDDRYFTAISSMNSAEMGDLHYSDTNLDFFFHLEKEQRPVYYNNETRRYVRLVANYLEHNGLQNARGSEFNVELEPCNPENFEGEAKQIMSVTLLTGLQPLCVPKGTELITSNQYLEQQTVKMMYIALEGC